MKFIAILLASNGGHSIGMGLLVGLALVLVTFVWNAIKKNKHDDRR